MNPGLMALLKKGIPAGVAAKALSKLSPQLGRFIGTAAAAGFGGDAVIEFLRQKTQPVGKRLSDQRLAERAQSGQATPDELKQLQEIEDARESRAKRSALLGLGAGAVAAGSGKIGEILGSLGQRTTQQAPISQPEIESRNYFQRAMEGVSFFDLDEGLKRRIGTLKKPLDNLEAQGVPWEDKTVQKLVRQMRRLVGEEGFVEQEAERVQAATPPKGS